MKKRYFYKNYLVRTSDHDYNFALVIENKEQGALYVLKCSASYQACERELNRVSKLYDALLAAGISFDDYKARQKERCEYYEEFRHFPDNTEFDNKVRKIIIDKHIWSDQYHDRRKLQIVELETR